MLIQFARLSTNHTRAIVIGAVVFVVAGVLGGGVADHLTSGGFEDPSSEPERADEAPAEHFWHRWLTDVSMYALTLTTALGLGLAIDCSLFVVSRYREELRAGYAPRIAASRTTRTVGFSALAVAESLLAGLVLPVRIPAQRRRRGRRGGATGQAVLGDGAAGDPRAAGPSDEGADRVAPLGDPPEEGVWRRISTVVTRGPNPIATAVVDAVPGLPNQIDAYATQLATQPAVTRVAAATGTYRGTESATQLGFNVDGATDLSLIPWDSGGRQ